MADTGRKRVAVDDALTRLRVAGVVEHRTASPGRPERYRLLVVEHTDHDVTAQAVASESDVTGSPVACLPERDQPGGRVEIVAAGTRPERGRNATGPPVAEG